MKRCLQLAALGAGYVAPNPMVGAVLVHGNRVIGEGYHEKYGAPHAEVNCLASVRENDKQYISQSSMIVSLEPCAHFGKTPPCADLIIRMKIPRVVVGCRDPFHQVDGRGIEKLRAAGIEVVEGILENECMELNKRFFSFHKMHRPYIILKWAQTSDKKIGRTISKEDRRNNKERLKISNVMTDRLVHRWRHEEAAILVGTNTAWSDDPELTTRLVPGSNPLRLLIDKELTLPSHKKIFSPPVSTIVFNYHRHSLADKVSPGDIKGVEYYQVTPDVNLAHQIVNGLYQMNIQSVLVEGGAYLLQSFIDEGLWDEARVITNEGLVADEGIAAPVLNDRHPLKTEKLVTDSIFYYANEFTE